MRRLFIASLILALGPWAHRPAAAAPAKEASKAFAEGKRLYEARQYIKAIVSFERAYELRPHFMVQCSIARCHENMSKVVQAARHYERCLSEGADRTKMKKMIRASVDSAEKRFTWLTVESPGAGGTIFLDGEEVGPAPKRFPVNPGKHAVEVRRSGATPARETLTTLGGEEHKLVMSPEALAAAKKPVPSAAVKTKAPSAKNKGLPQYWFWTAAGGAAALGIVGIVLGVKTLGARSDYEDDPTEGGHDSFTSMRLATNIVWGLAALAAGGATALFFYTDFGWGKERGDGGQRSAGVVVGLQGSF